MTMIAVVCEWCGQEFAAYACHRRRFCGKSCRAYWQAIAHPQPRLPEKVCPECGTTFRPKGAHSKLCSRACRGQVAGRAAAIAHRAASGGKGYRKVNGRHEHRVVAEQTLGRALLPGEVVHHIDGDKLNNHPDNLRVFPSQAEHARHHAKGHHADSIPA